VEFLHPYTNLSHADCSDLWQCVPVIISEENKLMSSNSTLQHTLEMDNLLFYKKKLHGLSLQENYTDRATAASWRSDCQLVRIEGATWSA
jgi:hypothetical protein